jgi:integrase
MRGHIKERSPGHWAIVIDVKDAAGERKRRWHSFQGTKREAQIERSRLITELKNGAAVDPSRATVSEFLDRFERDWVTPNTSRRTAERYADSLNHLRRACGSMKLQAVKPTHLAALYAELGRGGLAPATIRHLHVVAHRAFKEAQAWGLVRDNPVDQVQPPRMEHREATILQPQEAKALLARLRGGPLYLLASLALATGARRGELLAMRWKDIDLDAGRMTIERSLEQTAEYGVRAKAPKTKRGRRTSVTSCARTARRKPSSAWRAGSAAMMALPSCRTSTGGHSTRTQSPSNGKGWRQALPCTACATPTPRR